MPSSSIRQAVMSVQKSGAKGKAVVQKLKAAVMAVTHCEPKKGKK
jgi:hypothetical protein